MLRSKPIQLIDPEKVKPVPTWKLHPYILISSVWKILFRLSREEYKHHPRQKTFDLQLVLPANYISAVVVQTLWEKPNNVRFDLRFTSYSTQLVLSVEHILDNLEP